MQSKGEASPEKWRLQQQPQQQSSPREFAKPSDLFKMRRRISIEPQSPLKCLNSPLRPSPIKNLPVILKNPFNQVKRKLSLGSPNKKTRMLELDEDANLDPPEMGQLKRLKTSLDSPLKIKLRRNFGAQATTNNNREMYQHPYFSWLTLIPRKLNSGFKKKDMPFAFNNRPQAVEQMHKDWCDSLDDLINQLINGKCSFFYLCADNYNILFESTPKLRAFISPFQCGMEKKCKALSIEFRYPEVSRSNSVDSAAADLDDELNEDENGDTSQCFIESIGLSLEDFPTLQEPLTKKVAAESDSESSKSTNARKTAIVEGSEEVRKLVRFLQTNRIYTVSNAGIFAQIPPTLLSPCPFLLGTLRIMASGELDFFLINST